MAIGMDRGNAKKGAMSVTVRDAVFSPHSRVFLCTVHTPVFSTIVALLLAYPMSSAEERGIPHTLVTALMWCSMLLTYSEHGDPSHLRCTAVLSALSGVVQ